MVRIRKVYDRGFTTIDNTVINDKTLSWKAKGLFVYLWSQSDEWNFYEREVVKHATGGLTSLRTGIHELEKHGYLLRKRERKGGKVQGSIWLLKDSPNSDFLNQDKSESEKPNSENPNKVNRTLTNTNLNNNKYKQILTQSLSQEEKNRNLKMEAVENFFSNWNINLNEREKKKLKAIIDNFTIPELKAQAEKAAIFATDYPFGYMMTLLNNALEEKTHGNE